MAAILQMEMKTALWLSYVCNSSPEFFLFFLARGRTDIKVILRGPCIKAARTLGLEEIILYSEEKQNKD